MGSVNEPPASTSIVCPAGETRNIEPPCPTSKTFNWRLPGCQRGANGKIAIARAGAAKAEKLMRLCHTDQGEVWRSATANSMALRKKRSTSHSGGAGNRKSVV